MSIVKEVVYRHANLLLPAPTIFLAVDRRGGFKDLTNKEIANSLRILGIFIPALRALSNSLPQHSLNLPLRHLVGEYIARAALILQKEYVYPVEQGSGVLQSSDTRAAAAYEFHNRKLGLIAGRAAVTICALALCGAEDQREPIKAAYERFKKDADAIVPNLGTRFLLQEAALRDIPVFNLSSSDLPIASYQSIVQLGQGIKQARFLRGLTSKTSEMACELANCKSVASRLCAEQGIPVPPHGLAVNEDEALEIARKIGFPVVVKPNNQHNGVGVRTNITDETELKRALEPAFKFGAVLIEQYLKGFDHRLTFVGNDLVGILRVMPANIIGNGKSSIQQLIEASPISTPGVIRGKINVDTEVLGHISKRGYRPDDVLPAGERLVLRQWWRNQPDHSLEDVTPSAHADNVEVARLAVQLLGLDVAGVDFITSDISRPYHETGGAIVEVNPMPTLAGAQSCGLPAYQMLLASHFPRGDSGRIPTGLILGTCHASIVIDIAANMLAKCVSSVGIAARERFEISGRAIGSSLPHDAARADVIFRNPQSTVALLQTTSDIVAERGMPVDKCDVGVLLLPSEQGVTAKETDAQTAKLLCSISRKAVVLTASDPRAESLHDVAVDKRLIWILDELDTANLLQRRDGDVIVTISRFDGQHFISILDDQATHRIAVAPAELVQLGSMATARRRATLIGIGLAHELSTRLCDLSEFAQIMQKELASKY
ncbi:MAG: acetate--CoA ligase family protein [Hyphomicrobiales bacterium]